MPWGAVASVVGSVISAGAQSDAADSAANSSREATNASSKATADRLAFDERQYSDSAGDRQFASDRARRVADYQDQDRAKYTQLQDQQVARGKNFQGEEDRLLNEAGGYDTPERRADAARAAAADAEQQIAGTRAASSRAMERNGVNPGSAKFQALENGIDLAGAKLKSGASYKAGKDVETQGYARRMDAVGLGKGIIGNQATQAGLSLNAGNSSVGNAMIPVGVQRQAAGDMSAGFGNAAAGFGSTADRQTSNFYKSQAYGAGIGAGVGKALGSFGAGGGFGGGFNSMGNTSFSHMPWSDATSQYGAGVGSYLSGNLGSGD